MVDDESEYAASWNGTWYVLWGSGGLWDRAVNKQILLRVIILHGQTSVRFYECLVKICTVGSMALTRNKEMD